MAEEITQRHARPEEKGDALPHDSILLKARRNLTERALYRIGLMALLAGEGVMGRVWERGKGVRVREGG